MDIVKPKTKEEAIDNLEEFLELDMYTKFRPEHDLLGKRLDRVDTFESEEDFQEYLRGHFDILRKQLKDLEEK